MSKKCMFLNVFSKITISVCAFCVFFISPVFASLPAGYTELEYIESTGTQWLNLGKKGYSTHTYIFDLEPRQSPTTAWFGYRNAASVGGGQVLSGTFVGNTWGFYEKSTGGGVGVATSTRIQVVGQRELISWKPKSGSVNISGTDYDVKTSCVDENFETNDEVFLFTNSVNGVAGSVCKLKVYSFEEIDENVVKVMNLIPARRDSDGEIGMYDTVTNTFFTNQGTGDFIAGPVAEIKIATTKMVDDEFAAAEAKLATTVQTIESVVSRTITQTGQIQVLQDTKQTRPDESCPANMKCLLVQDEDGTPHWYPIIEP